MTKDDVGMILAELAKIGRKLDNRDALQESIRKDVTSLRDDTEAIREDVAAIREYVATMTTLPAEERPLNPLGAIKKDPWKRHWETLCARRASSR